MSYAGQVARAADELRMAAAGVNPDALAGLVDEVATARRVVCFGVGQRRVDDAGAGDAASIIWGWRRMWWGICPARRWGWVTCWWSARGPGDLSTVAALVRVARRDGARVACVTAQPGGAVPVASDRVLVIPAQTMADDTGPVVASVLPMGSVFEGAQFLVFEILILMLRGRLGVAPEAMRARHTNLGVTGWSC